MKKLLAIILSLSMLISLCACTVEDPNATPEEEITLGNVESEQNPDLNPTPDSDGEVIEEPETEDVLPDEDIISDDEVPAEDDSFDAFLESVSNDDFTLTLSGGPSTYYLDEEIFAEAYLSLIGHETLTVYSGDPILTYSLTGSTYFNDGQGGGMVATILAEYRFNNTEDAIYPLVKSGGWSQSDPNADFYEEFFRSEKYILPAGVYTLTCTLDYSTDPDDVLGTRKTLSLTYTFEVIDICKTPVEAPAILPTGDVDDDADPDSAIYVSSTLCIESDPPTPQVINKLPDGKAEALREYLRNATWVSEPSDCLYDVMISVDGYVVYYSTHCGSFANHEHRSYTHLSEEDRRAVNALLEGYAEIVVVEAPIDPVEEAEPAEQEPYVQVQYSGAAFFLTEGDSQTFINLISSIEWDEETADGLIDTNFFINNEHYQYSTERGVIYSLQPDSQFLWRSFTLSSDDKQMINDMLLMYITVDVSIPECDE